MTPTPTPRSVFTTLSPEFEAERRKLRKASAEAKALLGDAAQKLCAALEDEPIIAETPVEASAAMESAVEAIDEAIRRLESAGTEERSSAAPPRGGPTQRQGQFLAYIHQYSLVHGCAPAEADLQRFFQISPPSVHSMVVTLERRGFIRRVPGQARSITLARIPM